jgi:DNA-binding NarL/FixJ family response regulator
MTPAEALTIGRTATYSKIATSYSQEPRRSVARAILRSFIAGEPEASQTIDVMSRALAQTDEHSAYVADRVIAMLLRRDHVRRAHAIIEAVPTVPSELRSLRQAQVAAIAARQRRDDAANAALVEAEPHDEEDDLITGLLKVRASQTYLLLGRYDMAMRRGLSAALHFERVGAKLFAAMSLRTPMRIAHIIRGDVAIAREYGERAVNLAVEHGFTHHANETRSRLLLYAAELGDHARYARLEREVSGLDFETGIARTLHAITADRAADALCELDRLRMRDLRTSERLMCDALRVACLLTLRDPAPAAQFVDELHGVVELPRDASARRFYLLAEAIGIAVAVALGRLDEAHALAKRLHGVLEEALANYALGRATTVPPSFRSLALVIDAVKRSRETECRVHLTDAERRLIPMLDAGMDVHVIARETQRSIGTVRTHLEHLRDKLGVARSEDVPQRARDLGFT